MSNIELEKLIKQFSKLPSLGPRSAKRIVLHLLNNRETIMKPLADSINEVREAVHNCEICGNLTTNDICEICSHPKRDSSTICVVEGVADLWAIEDSGVFRGHYHVLNGTLSAINGTGPDDLRIRQLLQRIANNDIQEVIIATNATIEGQTTAHYLFELLNEFDIKISKLAYGIPMGGELDYVDDGTFNVAFKFRSDFKDTF